MGLPKKVNPVNPKKWSVYFSVYHKNRIAKPKTKKGKPGKPIFP